jgi:phage-related protein (TIGR01555 family)
MDGYQNFEAKLGMNADNMHSHSHYSLYPISRNRIQLEFAYRGSWICREVVDAVADDMTREGVEFKGEIDPERMEEMQAQITELGIWPSLNTCIKWARLYGGCLGVMLIDGQRLDTPLRPETVGKDQFKGILPLDRWLVWPHREDLITEYGPNIGLPKSYEVIANYGAIPQGNIHGSRVIRLDGFKLPYWQQQWENGWNASVLEPVWDRITAFDSATLGAAQTIYRSYLRTMSLKNLRSIIAQGGKLLDAVAQQMAMIRKYQSSEGLTLIDADDKFETHQYTFAGIGDIIDRLGHQLCGAARIPYVRLFGDSPSGLNNTGEGDLANYYDKCHSDQEKDLRPGLSLVFRLMHRSMYGEDPPEDFNFEFNSLYQIDDREKADTAGILTNAICMAVEKNVVRRDTALKELRQMSEETGVWSNISDEEIKEAEEEPPPSAMMMGELQSQELQLKNDKFQHEHAKAMAPGQLEGQKLKNEAMNNGPQPKNPAFGNQEIRPRGKNPAPKPKPGNNKKR